MNAQDIIDQVVHVADRYFDQTEIAKREEFKVQLLCTKIRELVALLNSAEIELNRSKELM